MTHPKTSVPWGHEPSAHSWNAWHGAGAFATPPANDLYAPRAQFGEYRDHFLGGRLPSGPSVNTLLPIVGQPVGPSLLNCVIYPGSKGDAVSQLQQFLNGRLDPSPGIPDDGFYDEPTLVAVKAFQKASGIEANGHVAAKTWFKLLFGGRVPWKDERPKTQARPRSSAKQPVAGWAVKDKFDVVMIKCGLQLPGDLRFTFQQVVDYGTRQGLAVILTTWAGALLTNGNEAIDFGLRALMMGQIGVESMDVIEDFNSCLVATSNATQQVHLEHAATYLARVVTRTGVNLFLALVHRIATKHDAKRDEAQLKISASDSKAGAAIDMRTGISEKPKLPTPTPIAPAPPVPVQYKNIEIVGSDNFKKQVNAALADINKTKSGAALLADIGARGKKITITETNKGNSCGGFTNDAMVLSDGKPGKGSASTVHFNPARKSIGSETWETRPPAVGLAHELIHAAHAANGTVNTAPTSNDSRPDPADPSKTATTLSEEARTVGLAPLIGSRTLKTAYAMNGTPGNHHVLGIDTVRRKVLFLGALLLPCIAQPNPLSHERKSFTMQITDANAKLEVQFHTVGDKLSIDYQFSNYCNSDIFLFNKMYDDIDDNGHYKVDSNLCIIEIEDNYLVISKKVPTLPNTLLVESLNIPCISVVAPGTSFRETVVLNLPLKVWSPYKFSDVPVKLVQPVFFQLGYLVGQASSKSLARTVLTTAGKALRFAAVTAGSQVLLKTGPFELVSA